MGAALDPRVAVCADYVQCSASSMRQLTVQRGVSQVTAPADKVGKTAATSDNTQRVISFDDENRLFVAKSWP